MKGLLLSSRRMRAIVPFTLLGIVIGVVGWGGFNTVMEATNSLEFCVSCHEMRNNVYEEYKKTVHYQNPSGVRAICSDCHVPRDWTHKVVRKIKATNELYHWVIGSIDTREKFEAKRAELARHEWDRMRANDSRECRNCHSYDAMDFHKQSPKASAAMTAAMKAGKTCIDCHKGIAHTFPDVTAAHRAAFSELAASARQFVPTAGSTLYAIAITPVYLARDGDAGNPDGELVPAAAAKVLDVDGEFLKLEIVGWQREGSQEIFYQRPGQRILVARLGDSALEKVEPIETTSDPNTGQTWTRSRVIVWARAGGFSVGIEPLWKIGARMNDDNCSICHAVHPPQSARANDWIGHINAMQRYTPLQDDEVALLQSYLQNHAGDAAPAAK